MFGKQNHHEHISPIPRLHLGHPLSCSITTINMSVTMIKLKPAPHFMTNINASSIQQSLRWLCPPPPPISVTITFKVNNRYYILCIGNYHQHRHYHYYLYQLIHSLNKTLFPT